MLKPRYAIFQLELSRVGVAEAGPRTEGVLDISTPPIDFTSLARGMGVPATKSADAVELVDDLRAALAEPGLHLIDVEIQRGRTARGSGPAELLADEVGQRQGLG